MLTTQRDPIDKKLKSAKVKLLLNNAFFGTLAMYLPLTDATDEHWCNTMATDYRRIYYNRKFVEELDVEEVQFVICHEILHVALDHFSRQSHRDAEYWNMACDYAINGMLVTDNIGKMPTRKFADPNAPTANGKAGERIGLYDSKYLEWSSEAIYDDLLTRKVKKKLTLDVHMSLGNGNQSSSISDIDNDGNVFRGGPDDGDGKGDDKAKDGAGGKAKNGKVPKVSREDLARLKDMFRNHVMQAAQNAQMAGQLPGCIRRMLSDLFEPKVNWREMLQQNIQSCLTDDFTWMKPNRRHMYGGIFMPSLKKEETIDIQIAIDMSGSITNEMGTEFLSEIYGIMQSYNDFQIGIVCFDTKSYNYQEFTRENVDDLLTYKLTGGGGTDFMAFWNYWMKHDLEPKRAVVFTDGFPNGTWGPDKYCDTLWIITAGQQTQVKPPFGQWAYFDSNNGIVDNG